MEKVCCKAANQVHKDPLFCHTQHLWDSSGPWILHVFLAAPTQTFHLHRLKIVISRNLVPHYLELCQDWLAQGVKEPLCPQAFVMQIELRSFWLADQIAAACNSAPGDTGSIETWKKSRGHPIPMFKTTAAHPRGMQTSSLCQDLQTP